MTKWKPAKHYSMFPGEITTTTTGDRGGKRSHVIFLCDPSFACHRDFVYRSIHIEMIFQIPVITVKAAPSIVLVDL